MKKPLGITPLLQRKVENAEVGPEIGSSISAINGIGQPLAESTRSFFEPRFGSDFSNVRVHKDGDAGELAEALQARAFAVGSGIVFAAGQFAPETSAGRHLLAHELVHVVQQAPHQYTPQRVSRVGKATDSDMPDEEAAVMDVVSPHVTKRYFPLPSLTVQRQPVPPAGKQPPKPLTRAEEIRLSFTSPGEITGTLNPPMTSLYNFAIDQPTLKKEHLAALQTILFLIKLFPGANVRVRAEGHADSTGDDIKINQPLSENRAVEVQKVLQSAAPVTVSHCGELCPVATNDTVAGRSRNRRVDIYLFSGKKPDDNDIDWPSLCSLVPVLCLCLKYPALCRKKDGDGDGIHWPCTSLLGALICGLVVCIAASAILRNPTLCLPGLPSLPELLCLLFPSLCRRKPKPPKKKEEACPINVDLPSGNLAVHAVWPILMLKKDFWMFLAFKDDPQDGCACRCGEYQQNVRGFAEIEFANGNVLRTTKVLTPGINLEEHVFHEDGDGSADSEYGHRSHPPRVIHTSKTDFVDAFFPDQANGCYYRGNDNPQFGIGIAQPDEVRRTWFLEFEGGPVDTCAVPGKRTPLKQYWKTWRINAEIRKPLPPQPPRTPRQPPVVCAGLPPNAKVGDTVSLSVRFEGDPEECFGKIDVRIIELSSTELRVLTRNSDQLNIAPEDCPDMWIYSYQVWTFMGSPPCGYVA